MKVGILTFQKVNNYGAVLQAYALQRTIASLGHESEIIDYSRENIKDVIAWQKNKILSIAKGNIDRQLCSNKEFIRMLVGEYIFSNKVVSEKFKTFRENFKLSEPVTKKTIAVLNNRYDLFISGSDQVWNCGRVNMDNSYFLDFVEKDSKKGSYAASFGITEIPQKYREEYKRLLAKYRYLSVREHVGAKMIKDLIGVEPKVVLDPTLLLGKEQWAEFFSPSTTKQKVIIVYQLGHSPELLKFARKLSKETGLEIVMLNKVISKESREKYREDVGPIEWMEAIYHAEYIVTNSFHGIAFSINFNKKFFVEVTKERIRGAMGSRIENILEVFDLSDRLINEGSNPNMLIPIDYTEINQKLETLKEESMQYLKNMLES